MRLEFAYGTTVGKLVEVCNILGDVFTWIAPNLVDVDEENLIAVEHELTSHEIVYWRV